MWNDIAGGWMICLRCEIVEIIIFMWKMDKRLTFSFLGLALAMMSASAQYGLEYDVSLTAGAGSGDFAPYYMSSLRHGRFLDADNVQAEVAVSRPVDVDKRFSYGFGLDLIAGYASSVDYQRYDVGNKAWFEHAVRPSSARIQQLYCDVRYRGIFLSAGMKEWGSALLNNRLTSGDLIESGNARPIPQLRAGFNDFQDIPFTGGWIQIQGEIAYGKKVDNGWWQDHYNYYNGFISRNEYYNYKRCYFRTRPSEPFSVTVGMQFCRSFGGTTDFYEKGVLLKSETRSVKARTLLQMLLPVQDGGELFYSGNHLGSWDFRARYRLKNGREIYAYFSWPFEDGSGIAKKNGWDGLWGLEYQSPVPSIVSGIVVEYLDFTNQSGPIHYKPDDFPGTTVTDHVSGSDDYYNHSFYNSYAYYGMSIGTPAIMSPAYNLDGYNKFAANVMRGFHVGVEGSVSSSVDYRLKGGYRKAYGDAQILLPRPLHLTSVMAEVCWRPVKLPGMSVNATVAYDNGSMPCNAFGTMVTVRYNGLLNL